MKKVNIFLSYSHKDSQGFDEVREALQSTEGDIGIELWDDTKIKVGDKWKNEIQTALKKTDIAILLVTRSFLTSSFVKDVEVKQLLSQYNKNSKTKIFIVILRRCAWKKINWLSEFQLFNSGAPLWNKDTTKRDENLEKLVDEIDKMAQSIRVKNSINKNPKPEKKTSNQKQKKKDSSNINNEAATLKNDDLPFTNHVQLLGILKPPENLKENSFTYATLTAPAGQGKSRLLLKLRDIYKSKGWDCGYALFDPQKGESVFVESLLRDLGISPKNIHHNKNLGKEFYEQYTKRKKGRKKPLVLFVDTLGNITKNELWLLDYNFIEDLDNYVRDDEYFEQPGKYRLFLTGRNISGDLVDSHNPEKYVDFKLSPFNYEDVFEMVMSNNMFGRLKREAKADFVADILYLSGGHPGLMAKIINRYEKERINRKGFVENYVNEFWNIDLANTIEVITSGIFDREKRIKEFAQATVALRYFNKPMIRKMFKGQAVEDIISNVINRSGLYRQSDESGLFSDGAIRDIYALYLLASEPEYFKLKCKDAQVLCWEEIISGIKIEDFMAEYIFQCLQESIAFSANNIHNQRKSIRRRFESKLKEFVGKLAKLRQEIERKDELLGGFLNLLRKQASNKEEDKNKALFRFWIIYIYKDKSYNIEVYKNFVSTAEKLISRHLDRSKK